MKSEVHFSDVVKHVAYVRIYGISYSKTKLFESYSNDLIFDNDLLQSECQRFYNQIQTSKFNRLIHNCIHHLKNISVVLSNTSFDKTTLHLLRTIIKRSITDLEDFDSVPESTLNLNSANFKSEKIETHIQKLDIPPPKDVDGLELLEMEERRKENNEEFSRLDVNLCGEEAYSSKLSCEHRDSIKDESIGFLNTQECGSFLKKLEKTNTDILEDTLQQEK